HQRVDPRLEGARLEDGGQEAGQERRPVEAAGRGPRPARGQLALGQGPLGPRPERPGRRPGQPRGRGNPRRPPRLTPSPQAGRTLRIEPETDSTTTLSPTEGASASISAAHSEPETKTRPRPSTKASVTRARWPIRRRL